MNDARQRPARFQFHLSYLMYVLTLIALGSALLRHVLDIHGGWQITAVLSAYLVALIAYFAFRFPMLVRRLARRRQSLRAKRSELRQMLEEARARAEQDKLADETPHREANR